MISARNRCPFTPNQWQELEHQALIFKHMVSGVPIPPQLIYSIKKSLDSSLASRLFPHQPFGWGCFQVGFGRKADAEPGRCRRTDGKKWRCSKQAYPDSNSKYCERHMHRGRNRSRKPVEVNSTATTTTTTSVFSPSFSSINSNLPISTSSNCSQPSISSFSSSPMASEIYTHHHNLNHFLDSGTGIYHSQADKDYRYVHNGARKGVDERSFFPSYQPLTVSSYKSYPQSENQDFGDNGSKQLQQQQQEQHCFVLGIDIKSARTIKLQKDDETQEPMHQFLGDLPPRKPDSWLDLASNSRVHSDS